MKRLFVRLSVAFAMAIAAVASALAAGDPRVENVRARQIPDTKDVEVVYDLIAPDGGLFNISAAFQAPGVTPAVKTVTGDFGSCISPGRNRRFVWNAGVDWPDNVNSNFVCTVNAKEQDDADHGGVQLWEGGPYWAECNVGASKPEECGLYFSWGDTVGHATWGGWFRRENCPTYGKRFFELWSLGYTDSSGHHLAASYDAATAYLGAPWRMPTDAEFDALINNCTLTWTTRNGVNGRLVTGKGAYASKSIFLPAAGYSCDSSFCDLGSLGYYWSSAQDHTDDWHYACCLFFNSNFFYRCDNYRHNGRSVRPVRGAAQ